MSVIFPPLLPISRPTTMSNASTTMLSHSPPPFTPYIPPSTIHIFPLDPIDSISGSELDEPQGPSVLENVDARRGSDGNGREMSDKEVLRVKVLASMSGAVTTALLSESQSPLPAGLLFSRCLCYCYDHSDPLRRPQDPHANLSTPIPLPPLSFPPIHLHITHLPHPSRTQRLRKVLQGRRS